VEIPQNFAAFSEYMNFILTCFYLAKFFGKEKFSTLAFKNKVTNDKKLFDNGKFSSVTLFLEGSTLNYFLKKNPCSLWHIIFEVLTCFHLTNFFAEGSSTVQRIRNEFAKGLSRKDSTTSSTATETTNMG
jgi:hypothetical protein